MSVKVSDLKVNDYVYYSLYKNVKFVGVKHGGDVVLLEDGEGSKKEVYVRLFEKYAKKR